MYCSRTDLALLTTKCEGVPTLGHLQPLGFVHPCGLLYTSLFRTPNMVMASAQCDGERPLRATGVVSSGVPPHATRPRLHCRRVCTMPRLPRNHAEQPGCLYQVMYQISDRACTRPRRGLSVESSQGPPGPKDLRITRDEISGGWDRTGLGDIGHNYIADVNGHGVSTPGIAR